VLDDVERGSLRVEPAREGSAPLALGIAHVELDEGSGELLDLPRGGGLAGPQAYDRVADADRLARLHRKVAGDAVALVEEAEHGDPLGHRSRAGRERRDGLRHVDRARLAGGLAVAVRVGLLSSAPAGGEEGERREGCGRPAHAWSGAHAS
jgi:hypothetical protein